MVPVPGTRKKRASKYWRSSIESAFSRSPSIGQHPLREEARVEREQTGRVGRRGLDVASPVADDEGVPVEDLDQLVAHVLRLRGSARPREEPLERHHEAEVALRLSTPRSMAAIAFTSARDQAVEERPVGAHDGVGLGFLARHGEVPVAMVRYQWSRAPPSTRSKRSVPETLPGAARGPASRGHRRTPQLRRSPWPSSSSWPSSGQPSRPNGRRRPRRGTRRAAAPPAPSSGT